MKRVLLTVQCNTVLSGSRPHRRVRDVIARVMWRASCLTQSTGGGHCPEYASFLSTPVLMHGGLIYIAFCPSVTGH